MEDLNPILSEVWAAFGEFIENLFEEQSREELMLVLQKHAVRLKEGAEIRSNLQSLSERLKDISSSHFAETAALSSSSKRLEADTAVKDASVNTEKKAQKNDMERKRKISADENLVQIHASAAEVRRRIAAFMASKRCEVNDINKREFCFGLPHSEEENSCARVDSVFVSHIGSTSRLRVTRVFNSQGPQTQHAYDGQLSRISHLACGVNSAAQIKKSLDERLTNIEQHLHMDSDSKLDVFCRLKALEERLLFLEGLSLEYFQDGVPLPKQMHHARTENAAEEFSSLTVKSEYESLSEIDQRIYALQEKLKEKMKHLQT